MRIQQTVSFIRWNNRLNILNIFIRLYNFRPALHPVEQHRSRLFEVANGVFLHNQRGAIVVVRLDVRLNFLYDIFVSHLISEIKFHLFTDNSA